MRIGMCLMLCWQLRKVVHFTITWVATLHITQCGYYTRKGNSKKAGRYQESWGLLLLNACDQLLHFLVFGMGIMIPSPFISRIIIKTTWCGCTLRVSRIEFLILQRKMDRKGRVEVRWSSSVLWSCVFFYYISHGHWESTGCLLFCVRNPAR